VAVSTITRLEHPSAPPSAAGAVPELPETVIEYRPGWRLLDVRELWRYRELLYFLTWRDIKIRYKQTVLGAAWAVLQPLATMLVFTLFLGQFVTSADDRVPYPLFVFAGLLPWTFLANAVGTAGQSVVANQKLVTKVHFPRLYIPTGAVGAGLVDFAVAFVILLVLMAGYAVAPGWSFLVVPFLIGGLGVVALGVGVLLSALTVAYRDFRFVVPFLVQFWMFATPSIYIQAPAGGSLGSYLLPLNPAQGLIANFRQAMLGGSLDMYSLVVSMTVGLGLLVFGCFYFRRVERRFADLL
jgi:lipopolysaccharide transport system permease protein